MNPNPLPFPSHYAEIDGFRCHYIDEGTGEPVVFLHGNPSWCFMFRRLIADLRGTCRVVAPDHIGCGYSEKPAPARYPYTLERRARDLEWLLDGIGIRDGVTLGVHDWGGPIGLTYAVRHPERISRLIVFNTAAFLMPAGRKLHWTIRICRKSRLMALLILRFNLFAVVASRVGCRQHPMPAKLRRAYRLPYHSPASRLAILRFIQDIPLEPDHPTYPVLKDTDERLRLLQEIPMLICWGERDFVFDRSFLEEWIRRFPKAQVHRFPLAGHYVVEDASREIIPRVRQFLARPGAPPSP